MLYSTTDGTCTTIPLTICTGHPLTIICILAILADHMLMQAIADIAQTLVAAAISRQFPCSTSIVVAIHGNTMNHICRADLADGNISSIRKIHSPMSGSVDIAIHADHVGLHRLAAGTCAGHDGFLRIQNPRVELVLAECGIDVNVAS